MLDWKKRCRKDQTDVSDRKIWETKCGKYRVTFSHIRYGTGPEVPIKRQLSDRYYAEALTDRGWKLVSKHQKKNPAFAACERRAKERENAVAKLERVERKTRRKGN